MRIKFASKIKNKVVLKTDTFSVNIQSFLHRSGQIMLPTFNLNPPQSYRKKQYDVVVIQIPRFFIPRIKVARKHKGLVYGF